MDRIALLAMGLSLFGGLAKAQTHHRSSERTRSVSIAASAERVLFHEDHRVRYASGLSIAFQGDPVDAALALIAANEEELGLDADELVLQRSIAAHGTTALRFQRVVDGLSVVGASVVVRLAGDRIDTIVASPGPRELVGEVRASAPLAAAVHATGWVGARARGAWLVAYDDGVALRRAWAVQVQGALHQKAIVYVDAESQALIAVHDLIRHGRGLVFQPNPVITPDAVEVELPATTSARFLTGEYVRAASCQPSGATGCRVEQRAEADAMGDFLYQPDDPAYDDEFSEVNVYYHTNLVAEYFRNVHGLEWTCCGESPIIDVVANYVETTGRPYENAFYSPSTCTLGHECASLAFGQGARDYGYDGDVVYHEFGHAIVDVTANLSPFDIDFQGVRYDTSALNEGTADYFSATLGNDPSMADYFSGGTLGGGEGALRNLDNDLVCGPDLFGEGHADGRIWAGTLWEIREAIGQDKADQLAFATLVELPADATLALGGASIRDTSAVLSALDDDDRATIDGILESRNLIDCSRVIEVEPGRTYRGFSGLAFSTGNLGGRLAPNHYAVEIPPNATSLTIHLESVSRFGQYELHVRQGEPLVYRGRLIGSEQSFSNAGEVVLDARSEYPLPRCTTAYFALIVDDLLSDGESVYEISFDLETRGEGGECPEPDAGTMDVPDAATDEPDAGTQMMSDDAGIDAAMMDSPDSDESGCGCRAPGTSSARAPLAGGLLLGLIFLGLRRRR